MSVVFVLPHLSWRLELGCKIHGPWQGPKSKNPHLPTNPSIKTVNFIRLNKVDQVNWIRVVNQIRWKRRGSSKYYKDVGTGPITERTKDRKGSEEGRRKRRGGRGSLSRIKPPDTRHFVVGTEDPNSLESNKTTVLYKDRPKRRGKNWNIHGPTVTL